MKLSFVPSSWENLIKSPSHKNKGTSWQEKEVFKDWLIGVGVYNFLQDY